MRMLLLAVCTSLALAAISSGNVLAQQLPAAPSSGTPVATEIKDTVVNPWSITDNVPVTNVYWRGRYYRGWARPYYAKPYRYGGYYYGYGKPRCWWNGYRWKCRPKRVIVY